MQYDIYHAVYNISFPTISMLHDILRITGEIPTIDFTASCYDGATGADKGFQKGG